MFNLKMALHLFIFMPEPVYGQLFTKSMGWHDLADFLTRYVKKDDDSQVVVSKDPERDAPRNFFIF